VTCNITETSETVPSRMRLHTKWTFFTRV